MPYDAEILVVGCGNILFKDDGFGPEVINALEDYFKDKEKIGRASCRERV